MALPTSYMTGSFTKIPQYFDTMLTAKAPDKFTTKFMAFWMIVEPQQKDTSNFWIKAFQNKWLLRE